MANQTVEYDVIIRGAGVAGLGVASGFARRKKRALVVDTLSLKGSGTLAAAGILHPFFCQAQTSPMIPILAEAFDFFKHWRPQWAPHEIGFSIHPVGMNYLACGTEEEQLLEAQYTWQIKKGVRIKKINRAKLLGNCPSLSPAISSGLNYRDVGYMEPRLFFKSVKKELKNKGVTFLDLPLPAEVSNRHGNFVLETKNKTFQALNYVDATGSWLAKNPDCSSIIEPLRGEVFVVSNQNIKLDTIYHTVEEFYVLPWQKWGTLLGSTSDRAGFRPSVTVKGKQYVFRGIQKILPSITEQKVIQSWAGLRPVTKDQLPVFGKITEKDSAFVIGGYFKNGMLLGPYLGDKLAEWIITGKQDRTLQILNPNRFKIRKK